MFRDWKFKFQVFIVPRLYVQNANASMLHNNTNYIGAYACI